MSPRRCRLDFCTDGVAVKLEFLKSGSNDCPLIRLYGFDVAAASRLMTLFRALADGSLQRIALHDQLGVESIQDCQLDLRSGSHDLGIRQTGPNTFECVLTSEGWTQVADLTGPFCEPGNSGEVYQWLNECGKVSLLLSPTGRW
jgi:hypothetical protein